MGNVRTIMFRKITLTTPLTFLSLSVASALAWWLVLFVWHISDFPSNDFGKVLGFLIGVAVVQLLSLLLVILFVVRARRTSQFGATWITSTVSVFSLGANMLYFFTPVVGALVALLVGVQALVGLAVMSHRSQAQSC